MSQVKADQIIVISAWLAGLVGPISHGDAAMALPWSLFALAVAGTAGFINGLGDALSGSSSAGQDKIGASTAP